MRSSRTYAYYPGCTLKSSAKEYDVSSRLVCEALGIELRELEDWICCGASSAHSTDPLLAMALPVHALQAAGEMGLSLAVTCAMCFSRFKITLNELGDKTKLEAIRGVIGEDIRQDVEVLHLLKVLDEQREDMPWRRSLEGLKVACYYGCLLVRPREIVDLGDEENPQIMDWLIQASGAETIEWAFKTECCGASLPLTRLDMVLKLSHRLLFQAKQGGADCMAVACPMCHSNLDIHQKEMKAKYQDDFELPVLYFTQLLGLALGFSPKQLGLDKHFTDTLPMLRSKGIWPG